MSSTLSYHSYSAAGSLWPFFFTSSRPFLWRLIFYLVLQQYYWWLGFALLSFDWSISPAFRDWHFVFFYACYGLLLVYLLFFKSMGVRGVNWDLLSTFSQDLFLNPAILVFNLLLFLPLGLLFSFSWKKLSLFVGAILLVEACQFFFSLGFFDLGDILLNTSGFALGNFLGQSAIAQSFNNRI